MFRIKHLTILIACLSWNSASCQVSPSSELFQTLYINDSLLFNVGFNNCDTLQFETLISDSFLFYHDQAGITYSKSRFISDFKRAVCNGDFETQRELDDETLEVYPLKKNNELYGAVQLGSHRFYHLKTGTKKLSSIAQFIHLWQLEGGEWRLIQGISFDHIDQDTVQQNLLFRDKTETEQWLNEKGIPALGISYLKDGKIEEVQVYGNLEKNKPAPKNTLWNVASLTKPVTTLVALKLVASGHWSLDEPLYPYWIDPDVTHDTLSRKLTTRHILSHQSGFPNWRFLAAGNKLMFEFEPGTKYQYSGEGFEYLRRGLESKFHTSLNELADSLIFEPLKMTNTRYYWDQNTDDNRFARWHDTEGNQYETYKNLSENAADDLLTTIEDYSKFMLHTMSGSGLPKTLAEEMFSNQVRLTEKKYWGLGWWVDEHVGPGENAIICGGDDKGVHTFAIMLPESNQGLIIFTNSDNGTEAYIPVILHYLGATGQGIIDIETKP